MQMKIDIRLKRAYEPVSPADGKRILVERLWPRGVRKEQAALDEWLKDIAPSQELRRWFAHDPAKWVEFERRYLQELEGNPEQVAYLEQIVSQGPVTFVYAARDEQHNSALILKRYIERHLDNSL
jgi:uncharacterized protein YeaO (DUF488 family)